MGLQMALPESNYENEQASIVEIFHSLMWHKLCGKIEAYKCYVICWLLLLLRKRVVFQQVSKAILSTLYNSYWIRIRKTDNDLVPFRTDDPFDQVLPYENWADFQTEEDDRKRSQLAFNLMLIWWRSRRASRPIKSYIISLSDFQWQPESNLDRHGVLCETSKISRQKSSVDRCEFDENLKEGDVGDWQLDDKTNDFTEINCFKVAECRKNLPMMFIKFTEFEVRKALKNLRAIICTGLGVHKIVN